MKNLYKSLRGVEPQWVKQLSGAGSNRQYFRLGGEDETLIGVEGTSVEENRTFIAMAQHFAAKGLPVPKVLVVSADERLYLQEDLGDSLLFDVLAASRQSGIVGDVEKDLLRRTIALLPDFQLKAAEGFDFSVCYPQPEFNRRSVLWDLNYFKYAFLKLAFPDFQENRLEDDFEKMADALTGSKPTAFMIRDFQSRNVMVRDGELYLIDFQGGRRGPMVYDLVSFLWQAKAQYSKELREELIDLYIKELQQHIELDAVDFKKQIALFALFRTLQVLGAYGFRGYVEQKAHFLESIPFALTNLKELLAHHNYNFPYLTEVLKVLTENQKLFTPTKSTAVKDITSKVEEAKASNLKVMVYSFSYKKGIPDDNSGNGGGFVFDCRAIHNPGKYDEYKQLTGRDRPVIDFLESDGEILNFLSHAEGVVGPAVERYQQRGFTNLMVSFGCTGGQHRSVYSAQHMAEWIHKKFGVKVELIHREQEIREEY